MPWPEDRCKGCAAGPALMLPRLSERVLMLGTERISDSVPGLRSWGSSAMGTPQFGQEELLLKDH